jgi:hypothetical protein
VRNRFGILDRIEALRWAAEAGPSGFSRVAICDGPDAELGDFMLIYEEGRDWASWGVAREGRAFCVWRTGARGLLGRFPSIRVALDAVLAEPRGRRRERRAFSGR